MLNVEHMESSSGAIIPLKSQEAALLSVENGGAALYKHNLIHIAIQFLPRIEKGTPRDIKVFSDAKPKRHLRVVISNNRLTFTLKVFFLRN